MLRSDYTSKAGLRLFCDLVEDLEHPRRLLAAGRKSWRGHLWSSIRWLSARERQHQSCREVTLFKHELTSNALNPVWEDKTSPRLWTIWSILKHIETKQDLYHLFDVLQLPFFPASPMKSFSVGLAEWRECRTWGWQRLQVLGGTCMSYRDQKMIQEKGSWKESSFFLQSHSTFLCDFFSGRRCFLPKFQFTNRTADEFTCRISDVVSEWKKLNAWNIYIEIWHTCAVYNINIYIYIYIIEGSLEV